MIETSNSLLAFWPVRRLTEFLVIIVGVVLSFYMEDLRQDLEKGEYKDQLIDELIVASNEDLGRSFDPLNLNECLVAGVLIKDLLSEERELSDEKVADSYLTIVKKCTRVLSTVRHLSTANRIWLP